MNNFLENFKEGLIAFWETSTEEEKNELIADILIYANANPDSFKRDVKEILFDPEVRPLPFVLEALSKDTKNWGDFYVNVLNDILEKAEQTDKPEHILTFTYEFYYTEEADGEFVQRIANRLLKALDSEKEAVRLKAICTLPGYLRNPVIKNRDLILSRLEEKLNDKSWKARYLAFQYLKFEDLLPKGRRLSFKDKILKMLFGEPGSI